MQASHLDTDTNPAAAVASILPPVASAPVVAVIPEAPLATDSIGPVLPVLPVPPVIVGPVAPVVPVSSSKPVSADPVGASSSGNSFSTDIGGGTINFDGLVSLINCSSASVRLYNFNASCSVTA